MKKYGLDHVCVATLDAEAAIRFYNELLGMEVSKMVGEGPDRKIWLDGGIQIKEVKELGKQDGCVDHIAFYIPEDEKDAVVEKALALGCTRLPKKGYWLETPDGLLLEFSGKNRTIG